jgi:gluconokinase
LIIVVMGVSGSGKTTIGRLLAQRLACEFADADDFHSADNKAKMRAGIPLTDEDRLPWLDSLAELFESRERQNQLLVVACSALKESYRQLFLNSDRNLLFVYLKIDYETVALRLHERHHEFMNPDLLKSQFETLEEPKDAIIVDASETPEKIVDEILAEVQTKKNALKAE